LKQRWNFAGEFFPEMTASVKIARLGAGSVGAAISYALLIRQTASELLLVDVDKSRGIYYSSSSDISQTISGR
jgi:malate/lactate dehydrogenase